MKIESMRNEKIETFVEFAEEHTKKAIILIKEEEWAKRLERKNKNLQFETVTYAENKKIFLLRSIGT